MKNISIFIIILLSLLIYLYYFGDGQQCICKHASTKFISGILAPTYHNLCSSIRIVTIITQYRHSQHKGLALDGLFTFMRHAFSLINQAKFVITLSSSAEKIMLLNSPWTIQMIFFYCLLTVGPLDKTHNIFGHYGSTK